MDREHLRLWKSVRVNEYEGLEERIRKTVDKGKQDFAAARQYENTQIRPLFERMELDYFGGEGIIPSRKIVKEEYISIFEGMAVYDYFSSQLLSDATFSSSLMQHVFVVTPEFSKDEDYKLYAAKELQKGYTKIREMYGAIPMFIPDVFISGPRVGIFSPR